MSTISKEDMLWESALVRYEALYNLAEALHQGFKGEGNPGYGIPACEFCIADYNTTGGSCEACAWEKVMGNCNDEGSNWVKMSDLAWDLLSELELTIAGIKKQLGREYK